MKLVSLFCLSAVSILPSISAAQTNIPYCKDTSPSVSENTILQKLVPSFAKDMGCEIGDNCLLKWNDQGTTKFSIAWKAICGPIIDGVYQLGDQDGKGSTFVCSHDKQNVCCWPLGYDQYRSCIKMKNISQ